MPFTTTQSHFVRQLPVKGSLFNSLSLAFGSPDPSKREPFGIVRLSYFSGYTRFCATYATRQG